MRGEVSKSDGAQRAGIPGPGRKSVRQEFLHSPRPLNAEIRCGQLQRAGQVTLHGYLPVLRVANAEIRIDCESVSRDRATGVKSIPERERTSRAVLYT